MKNRKGITKRAGKLLVVWLLLFSAVWSGCGSLPESGEESLPSLEQGASGGQDTGAADTAGVPEYSGETYVEMNGNQPEFTESELQPEAFESYSELDSLGRCQEAEACVGTETMPEEERGAIGQIKPSGWHTVKYDEVDGKYLYNRCHLIGYQLTAENANEKNLITGTRYMNTEGMLPFENEVAEYVKETDNHVLYRVTPVFEGDNLVASGVQMEAESVEDDGAGVCFNVYIYNVQPGIEIDYATGDSHEARETVEENGASSGVTSGETDSGDETTYIVNKNTGKFHLPDCGSVADIKPRNKKEVTGSRDELLEQGYEPCGRCRP
ncbi:MAG TPA: DNA/RNA non-specific endonuclease [Candidatus Bariatricus faecipullorum]|nr:DNA/RNA non-specific endonuclease [Candidatus Bariatricus faecipullorum]